MQSLPPLPVQAAVKFFKTCRRPSLHKRNCTCKALARLRLAPELPLLRRAALHATGTCQRLSGSSRGQRHDAAWQPYLHQCWLQNHRGVAADGTATRPHGGWLHSHDSLLQSSGFVWKSREFFEHALLLHSRCWAQGRQGSRPSRQAGRCPHNAA